MTKNFSLERTSRRGFLKAGVIGGAGLAVAQFALPKQLSANPLYHGQVSQSLDDAREDSMIGVVTTNGTSMNPIHGCWCGFRFQNVNIAKGTMINAATLSLCFDNALDPGGVQGVGGCSVYGQAADNALAFAAVRHNLSGRPGTSASVSFPAPGPNGFQPSPDISAVIQEIINRTGWVSGNSLVLLTFASAAFAAVFAVIDTWDTNPLGPPNLGAILDIS